MSSLLEHFCSSLSPSPSRRCLPQTPFSLFQSAYHTLSDSPPFFLVGIPRLPQRRAALFVGEPESFLSSPEQQCRRRRLNKFRIIKKSSFFCRARNMTCGHQLGSCDHFRRPQKEFSSLSLSLVCISLAIYLRSILVICHINFADGFTQNVLFPSSSSSSAAALGTIALWPFRFTLARRRRRMRERRNAVKLRQRVSSPKVRCLNSARIPNLNRCTKGWPDTARFKKHAKHFALFHSYPDFVFWFKDCLKCSVSALLCLPGTS